jgi:hypothetical protein
MGNSKLEKLFGRAKNTATRHNLPGSNAVSQDIFKDLMTLKARAKGAADGPYLKKSDD